MVRKLKSIGLHLSYSALVDAGFIPTKDYFARQTRGNVYHRVSIDYRSSYGLKHIELILSAFSEEVRAFLRETLLRSGLTRSYEDSGTFPFAATVLNKLARNNARSEMQPLGNVRTHLGYACGAIGQNSSVDRIIQNDIVHHALPFFDQFTDIVEVEERAYCGDLRLKKVFSRIVPLALSYKFGPVTHTEAWLDRIKSTETSAVEAAVVERIEAELRGAN